MFGFLKHLNPVTFYHDVGDGIDAVGDGVKAGVGGIKHGVSKIGGVVVNVANKVGDGVTDAVDIIEEGTVDAWEATSHEAAIIGHAVESTGLTIGKGMIDGANAAAHLAEEGVELTGKGLVAFGKYISSHICDLALGTALGGIFAALAADGEEEGEFGALAVAVEIVNEAELNIACDALAKSLVEPIYLIPGVPSSVGHKDQFEEVLSFVISSTVSQNPELVVGTAGQYVAGAVISTVTSIVCEGKVPAGGPKLWHGAQG